MKRVSIAIFCLALGLSGCASAPRHQFKPKHHRRGQTPTLAPEPAPGFGAPNLGTPGLGTPDFGAPGSNPPPADFSSPSNNSLYKPSGPVLELPESLGDEPPLTGPQTRAPTLRRVSNLEAPSPHQAPASHQTLYRPGIPANTVSSMTRPALLDEPVWERSYRSTGRRPIETLTFGQGAATVAVLGSLHGDEAQSLAIIDELARHLQRNPDQLQGRTVRLIRTANPDGVAGRSPYNAQGIDLNRNFPAANWKALPTRRAGDRAASEVETRVIIRLLTEQRPDLVIHLKDGRGAATVNLEGIASRDRKRLGPALQGYAVAEGLGERTSGSLENWALSRLQTPSLTFLIPRESSAQIAWEQHKPALLAALQLPARRAAATAGETATATTTSPPATNGGAEQPIDDSALSQDADPFAQPGRTPKADPFGAEAFAEKRPKTPAALPDFPLPVPEHGYLELPPPPE